jgi:hypothetical protein
MARQLLVIGGDAAGMSAASQARRLLGPDELAITVVERGDTTSYAACGIPYWVAGLVEGREHLIARRAEVFRDKQHIDVRLHHEATAIDTSAGPSPSRPRRRHRADVLGYDDLLIATGAQPVPPPVDGLDTPGVFGVQTLGDGQRILDALTDRSPRRAVVVGGGYIGLEMAEAMQLRGLDVTLVDLAPQPMVTLERELGDRIADAMRGMGIDLRLGTPLTGVEAGEDGWVRAVTTPDGHRDRPRRARDRDPSAQRPREQTAASRSGRAAASSPTTVSAPPSTACGPPATARRRPTASRGAPCRSRSAPSRTSRAASPGSTSVARGKVPGVLGTAVTKIHDLEIARTG